MFLTLPYSFLKHLFFPYSPCFFSDTISHYLLIPPDTLLKSKLFPHSLYKCSAPCLIRSHTPFTNTPPPQQQQEGFSSFMTFLSLLSLLVSASFTAARTRQQRTACGSTFSPPSSLRRDGWQKVTPARDRSDSVSGTFVD